MGRRNVGRVLLIVALGLLVIATTAMVEAKLQHQADRIEWRDGGKEVVLTGGVEVRIAAAKGPEIVLTAEDMVYHREKGTVTATATPKVVQGALSATGQSITVDENTGNITIAKGTLKGTDATAKADAISIALYKVELKGAAELTTGMGTFSGTTLKLSFAADGKLNSFISEQSKGSMGAPAKPKSPAPPAKKPAP